jgi:hypothetical protein
VLPHHPLADYSLDIQKVVAACLAWAVHAQVGQAGKVLAPAEVASGGDGLAFDAVVAYVEMELKTLVVQGGIDQAWLLWEESLLDQVKFED